MHPTQRLGFLSALGLALVGVAYVVVVGFGIAQAGLDDPIVDPILIRDGSPHLNIRVAHCHAHGRHLPFCE